MMLKLYLLVVVIYCVQLCSCAAIIEEPLTEKPVMSGEQQLQNNKIEHFRNLLLSIPKADPKKVDDFVNKLKNVTKECVIHLLFLGTNITKDELAEIFVLNTDDMMSEDDLVKVESYIRDKLTSEETLRIMNTLRKFRKGFTSTEIREGAVELYLHAIPKALGLPQNCIAKQSLIDFFNEKDAAVQNENAKLGQRR